MCELAETICLENRQGQECPSGVRIPLSPPFNAELAQLAEQPICGDSLQLLREIVIAYDAKTRKADQVMLKSISC